MNLLTIEHLTKSYTERLLFNDTAFSINEGEKVGLIASTAQENPRFCALLPVWRSRMAAPL